MIWLMIATVCAFFVKGLCGFANTLVFTTILGFTIDNVNISPLEVILGYPSNVILAYKERVYLDRKIWIPLTGLMLAGSIPGIFLLKNIDATVIKMIFGVVVMLLGVEMLFRGKTKQSDKGKQSKIGNLILGVAAGLLCGLYGVGAMLGAYVSRVTDNNHSFKANICIIFVIENTIRIILYTCTGILTADIWKQAFIMAPVMLIATFLGMKSETVLNEKTVQKLVIILLIISGAAIIINGLS